MPKVTLTDKRRSDDKLRFYIDQQCGGLHLTKTELAQKLGFTRTDPFNKRMRNPDLFTRGELFTLFKVLRFTEEQKIEVMR